jgi:signal peptidase II
MHPNLKIYKSTISKKVIFINSSAFTLFIADRILKYYFLKHPAAAIGGDFFNLTLAVNSGIAFGILIGQTVLVTLTVIIILIIINLLVKAYQKNNYWEIISLTLIVVGAISNLIDRVKFGYVIDYFNVPWFTVFNLADCLITIGVAVLLLQILIKEKTGQKTKNRII